MRFGLDTLLRDSHVRAFSGVLERNEHLKHIYLGCLIRQGVVVVPRREIVVECFVVDDSISVNEAIGQDLTLVDWVVGSACLHKKLVGEHSIRGRVR